MFFFFFSSRRRHTRWNCDWSSDVCSSDLPDLWLKHEGHNPTGSFKDRGMTVGVTQARRVRARAVACASTGNTAAALAAYAALAELPALVLGNFDDCLELADQASERLGVYLLNSVNPFRLEGQKTIVLELLQQLGWESPHWIVVPAGNLGNTAAFGKALEEARAWGLIDHAPRLAAIQAQGAAPFALSFREGFAQRHRVEPHTVASAINIGNPVSYERAVRAIRDTNGVVTTVSDDEILEAKAVVDAAGIGCEPASAAALAGTARLIRERVIRPSDRVVAVLTGHVLKDPETVTRYHQELEPRPARANRPIEIEARLGEVERAAVQRRALPTARAHAVLRTPFGRQLAGPGRARHDGPPRGWPRDDLNEVVGDLEGPAVNVEDGFERGEPRYAVPSPAPQRAVDVHLETTPLHSGHGRKYVGWPPGERDPGYTHFGNLLQGSAWRPIIMSAIISALPERMVAARSFWYSESRGSTSGHTAPWSGTNNPATAPMPPSRMCRPVGFSYTAVSR